ncbi:MAG TPA: pyridoxal-phosphate dependent enzyme, partial [Acidobacteriota bacterium]|nr:pyridoxal-phosphate dependent enzyme [Acidobacteriota bacterium]
ALELVRELAEDGAAVVVNSVNPDRIEGQKTIAWEIASALGRVPDLHALPVGNAGNITAAWKGWTERDRAEGGGRPRMMGFQAAGAAPIVEGKRVDDPKTLATAIKIGNPASWSGAVAARDESGGVIEAVTDEEIVEAYRALASLEGVFVEPASAAGVAGLLKLAARGALGGARLAVVTVTGHGLKDPERAVAVSEAFETVDADPEALRRAILA